MRRKQAGKDRKGKVEKAGRKEFTKERVEKVDQVRHTMEQ